jgi:hypothetical protein
MWVENHLYGNHTQVGGCEKHKALKARHKILYAPNKKAIITKIPLIKSTFNR